MMHRIGRLANSCSRVSLLSMAWPPMHKRAHHRTSSVYAAKLASSTPWMRSRPQPLRLCHAIRVAQAEPSDSLALDHIVAHPIHASLALTFGCACIRAVESRSYRQRVELCDRAVQFRSLYGSINCAAL